MERILIILVLLIYFSENSNAQDYIKLELPTKRIQNSVNTIVPDYGGLFETINSLLRSKSDLTCLKEINKDIEKKITTERIKLGVIENRPLNLNSDSFDYILGIDLKNCRVLSLVKNDSQRVWPSSTIIYKVKLVPIIKISNSLSF